MSFALQVRTKRSALKLIDKRRRQEMVTPNRSSRRQQKSYKTAATPSRRTSIPVQSHLRSTASADDAPKAKDEEQIEPRGMTEVFGGLRKTLEAVNQQSYYQALAFNKELEEKGVLPPSRKKEDNDSRDKEQKSDPADDLRVNEGDARDVPAALGALDEPQSSQTAESQRPANHGKRRGQGKRSKKFSGRRK